MATRSEFIDQIRTELLANGVHPELWDNVGTHIKYMKYDQLQAVLIIIKTLKQEND
jgi:hypothetical protein